MQIKASKKYRESIDAISSEFKAPRKIIGWLIGLMCVNTVISGYVLWLLNTQ